MKTPSPIPFIVILIVFSIIIALTGASFLFIKNLAAHVVHVQVPDDLSAVHFQMRKPTPPSIALVAPWMTFEYLEKIFQLPPGDLAQALPISDPRYPRLSIRSYARTHNLSVTSTLQTIQNQLYIFFTTSSPTSSEVWK
jgi:hypothetical protein